MCHTTPGDRRRRTRQYACLPTAFGAPTDNVTHPPAYPSPIASSPCTRSEAHENQTEPSARLGCDRWPWPASRFPAFTPAFAASLTEVTSFGNNPGGMRMHIYVPDSRPANPAIVVAMHGCGGSGPGFYSGSEFASLADQYGFIVIYPSAMQEAGFGKCFDTWSDAAKRRGGGSDPVSIVSMVTYAGQQYGGDQNRVYATGSSSGGMMTQHMLALYPDLFKAGAAFMGVPFNCFANAADYPPGAASAPAAA